MPTEHVCMQHWSYLMKHVWHTQLIVQAQQTLSTKHGRLNYCSNESNTWQFGCLQVCCFRYAATVLLIKPHFYKALLVCQIHFEWPTNKQTHSMHHEVSERHFQIKLQTVATPQELKVISYLYKSVCCPIIVLVDLYISLPRLLLSTMISLAQMECTVYHKVKLPWLAGLLHGCWIQGRTCVAGY